LGILGFIIPIMFAFIIVLASSLLGVSAQSGDMLSAFGTATVDGVISPGEYGSSIGPITQGAYTFTIYETNDLENDYYAFTINDLTREDGDLLQIYFDNEDDGVVPHDTGGNIDLYEDAIWVAGIDGTFYDRHYEMISGAFQAPPDSVSNGAAAVTWTPEQGYVYEMSHPLNSGDPRDYSLSPISTVGWGLMYDAYNGASHVFVTYPAGFNIPAGVGDASKYGTILKLSGETPVGGVTLPTNKLEILTLYMGLIGLIVAISTVYVIKKRKQ
jgi:hypothetical protein